MYLHFVKFLKLLVDEVATRKHVIGLTRDDVHVQVVNCLSSTLTLLDRYCRRVCLKNLLDQLSEMLDGKRYFEKLLSSKVFESEFWLLGADQDVAGKDLVVRYHCVNMGPIVEHIFGIYVHVAELNVCFVRSLHFKY